jgi:hypothetical protein
MFVGFGAGTGAAFGDNDILNWNFATTEVPEPATISALGLGIAGLTLFARKRNRR